MSALTNPFANPLYYDMEYMCDLFVYANQFIWVEWPK